MIDITQIDDRIWQGGGIASMTAVPPGIDAVLDLQWEHEDVLSTVGLKAFCWMPILDLPIFPGLPWLEAAVGFVERAAAAGWTTLIHCAAGVSRSGMVDAAYQMKSRRLSRDKALEFIRTKRPQTSPNGAFMAGLLDYERSLPLTLGAQG